MNPRVFGILAMLLVGMLLVGMKIAEAQTTPPPPKPEPRITFGESAVVASGLTPKEKVAWFAVERRFDEDLSEELARRYDVVDVEADGTARFPLKEPAAPSSFWVAVELKSGAFVVAVPNGFRLARPQKPSRLGLRDGLAADEILDERPYLMGLVVRPGNGAWAFAGGDGGPRDEDGKNDGRLRFALDRLQPLAGSPEAPSKARGEDLWFIVDPAKMEIAVHKGGIAQ